MPNAWTIHLNAFREANPDLSFKEALQKASLTYEKQEPKPKPKPKPKSKSKSKEMTGEGFADVFKFDSINKRKPELIKSRKPDHNTDFNMKQRLPDKYKNVIDKKLQGYTKKVANMIMKHQDKVITDIKVCRTPVVSALQSLLNMASMGRADQNKTANGYDDYFHLFIVINDVFRLEKNEVINFDKITRIPKEADVIDVDVPDGLTIEELLTNTQQKQGHKFFRYSASSNNCQMFIRDMFMSNGIGDADDLEFVMQDTKYIFENSPKLRKFANVLTDTGALLRKL